MTSINKPKKNIKNYIKHAKLIDLKSHSIQQLYGLAQQAYLASKKDNTDKWNKVIATKGTKKDKIAALVNLINHNPQSSLQYFEQLLSWANDQNAAFAVSSCQAVAQLYEQSIFSEKPRLKIFVDLVQEHIKNNKKNSQVQDAEIIAFYMEHKLKHFYGELIKAFEGLIERNILYVKKVCIKTLSRLAKFQELRRTVLQLIINKFGDADKAVVNEVTKCMKNDFYNDLNASNVLLEEIQVFLFRPNQPLKVQFYIVNFLNTLNLKYLTEKNLSRLFEIFYHFFNKMMGNQSQESYSSRLFLNSTKGLNRILSFLKGGNTQTKQSIQQKTQKIYEVIHKTKNIKTKIQLLLFLFQSHSHLQGNLPDRFYRILYDFLIHDEILSCSLSEMFFDMTLITLRQDENLVRLLAFIKRLLQVCARAPSNFIITTLLMIAKLIEQKDSLKIFISQKENLLKEEYNQIKQQQATNNRDKSIQYDMHKREPLYCGAQKSAVWQIRAFITHYHPTVRKFADCILHNKPIEYEGGNPLLQFSLTSFIEKFSLRKQKKSDGWKIKVKKNLPRIRSSKYQSLIEKPLQNYQQDEYFIKKYLEKRKVYHDNSRKIKQPADIQEFADEVVEKEIDRLNPSQSDMMDDEQISYEDEDINEQEQIQEGQGGQEEQEGQEFQDDQDLGNSEEIQEQLKEGQSFDEDMEDEQSADVQFQDAFDQIGDSSSYEIKKNKKISKAPKMFSLANKFRNKRGY